MDPNQRQANFRMLPGGHSSTDGQPEAGLEVLVEAFAHVNDTDERFYEAELYRVQSELLLRQGKSNAAAAAETCLRRSLDVARAQKAKSWELRTATSLARLWRDQDQPHQAGDLLAPVYGWFTEGFDTPDLKDAMALLDELA
jgi:predicted ATPase